MASLFLLSVLIVIVLVGFVVIWRKVDQDTKTVIDLINELGSQVGAYVDAMKDKKK